MQQPRQSVSEHPQQPRQGRPGPSYTNVYRGQKNRARKRRRRTGLIVMAALVLVLFVSALFLAAQSGAGSPVSSLGFSVPSVPAVSVAAPASSSEPQPPPRQPTPYDEEEMPPLYNYIGRNFIPDDYELDLIEVGGDRNQKMQRRAGEAFMAMREAAAADGVTLRALSGYRSHETQTNNYNYALNNYLNNGLSQEEALYRTQRYYAYPGTSEHEAGLAMDIGDPSVPGTDIEDGFDQTPAFNWLQLHAVEYGFIFRYQAHTEDITGIAYEPWHYRYVGANHAEKIVELELTLEEYVEQFGGTSTPSAGL